jgi:hypothetical protein
MTWGSKTEQACDCGVLEQAAKNPDIPIEFDPRLNEFQIVFTCNGEAGQMNIYHCLFCGGLAPPSLRKTLFAEVPVAENHRLASMTGQLATLVDVFAELGEPDRDEHGGVTVTTPEQDGQPPETRAYRTLLYTRLSDVADIRVVVSDSDQVSFSFLGKYLGDTVR